MKVQAADNREIFEHMPVPRALATLAVPTIIGQLIVLIYSLADTFFIGRTGNPYMVAAASLILPVFNICVPLSNMFGYATDLRSGTQGRAMYTMQFDSYEPVPKSVQEEIVSKAGGNA